jgi:hypothetical protein
MTIPGDEYHCDAKALKPIPARKIDLGRRGGHDIRHDLADKAWKSFRQAGTH